MCKEPRYRKSAIRFPTLKLTHALQTMRKFAALAACAAALSFAAPASAMDGKGLAKFKAENPCSKCDLKRASISRG